jgi:hypothetical protein
MNLPEIAIYNFSAKGDVEVQKAVRAVNRQVAEDFIRVWGAGYQCSLKNSAFTGTPGEAIADEPVSADAAIYIVDESHLAGAAGYHFKNGREVPYGFVFIESGPWTITLSHEVLELIIDPMVNAFVPGPDPRPGGTGAVLFAYEVCDPVERTSYQVDGVAVSNFVTPQYFSFGDGAGTRNDFRGTPLKSFGLLPGCHVGFIDLSTGDYETYVRSGQTADAFDALPAPRAAALKESALASPRISDALEHAVEAQIKNCANPGVREVLKGALRRNGYKRAAAKLAGSRKT